VGGALVAATGCATAEEWQIWRSNGAHFASGDHMFFSVRNRDSAGTKTVTRKDITLARDQGWCGKAISVDQNQILER
jgi:EAL domain-containing protein (putative c-di-GMP-specific phosphodiesterase class I)